MKHRLYPVVLMAFASVCSASLSEAGAKESEISLKKIEGLFQAAENSHGSSSSGHVTGLFTVARHYGAASQTRVSRFDLKWSGRTIAETFDLTTAGNRHEPHAESGAENIRLVLAQGVSRAFYGTIDPAGTSRGTGIIKIAPAPETRSPDDFDLILRQQAGALWVPNFSPSKLQEAYRVEEGENDLVFAVFKDMGLIYRIGFLLNEAGVITRYEVFVNGQKKLELRSEKFISTSDGRRFPSLLIKKRFKTTDLPPEIRKRLNPPYSRESLDRAPAAEKTTYTIQVATANLNPVFKDNDFQLVFPSGTTVTDERTGIESVSP